MDVPCIFDGQSAVVNNFMIVQAVVRTTIAKMFWETAPIGLQDPVTGAWNVVYSPSEGGT